MRIDKDRFPGLVREANWHFAWFSRSELQSTLDAIDAYNRAHPR